MLADGMILHAFKSGDRIITEGDHGSSMYGLAEGVLEVAIDQGGVPLTVARVEPGECFGEMSMLADEPRSATVTAVVASLVYEVKRETFKTNLEQRSELLTSNSELIARRQLANSEALDNASSSERDAAISQAASSLAWQNCRSVQRTASPKQ